VTAPADRVGAEAPADPPLRAVRRRPPACGAPRRGDADGSGAGL